MQQLRQVLWGWGGHERVLRVRAGSGLTGGVSWVVGCIRISASGFSARYVRLLPG